MHMCKLLLNSESLVLPSLKRGFGEHIFYSPTIMLLFLTAPPATCYVRLSAWAVNSLPADLG